ncbi:YdbL family protein [Sphingomonas sp. NSE70-1]|uniref:YdbL family protein n=1 Tax=Sphingomonas caseinilyticus TaxID=2908205 RepID=A0ABT0RSP8_9SPHN|nr:YdbL family protein [Sphingomonas caseinilyticus]MCL6698029.1 YdbL family protein [Sphingomonas caseinilyticus]
MRALLFGLLAFSSLAMPASAPAQDSSAIVAARRSGQVGERFDGYLGLSSANVSADVRRHVGAVNIRRRALYSNLAARKGVTPEEVGITAACSLLRRVSVGEYYLLNQGGWRRLVAGQSAVPTYCG